MNIQKYGYNAVVTDRYLYDNNYALSYNLNSKICVLILKNDTSNYEEYTVVFISSYMPILSFIPSLIQSSFSPASFKVTQNIGCILIFCKQLLKLRH